MNVVNDDTNHCSPSNKKTNKKAITSLFIGVLSIISVFTPGVGIPLISISLAIIGIVLGALGLKEIKHTKQPGRKLGFTGLTFCSVVIAFFLVMATLTYVY